MGKPSTRAQNKYNAKAYDRFSLMLAKGKKSEIRAHSEILGESVNGFINRAIAETMERDFINHTTKHTNAEVVDGVIVHGMED